MKNQNVIKTILAIVAIVTSLPVMAQSHVGKRVSAMDASAWDKSIWLSVRDAEVVTRKITTQDFLAADGASFFMSTMKNEKKVVAAKWMTTGLGVYELYINGKIVGDEILKPGFTHYAKTKRSFTYDVTDALNLVAGGVNVFSVQVTPGWWADKIITPSGHDGMIGKKCAFRGVIEFTYADGSKKLYGTNLKDWKAGIAGPVKHAAIFDGETYDARIRPGYASAGKFSAPEQNTEFSGEILPSEGAEIYLRPDLALSPVKAYLWKGVTDAHEDAYGKVIVTKTFAATDELIVRPGETLVVDFGQNCAAVPSFVFAAKAGTVLTCLPSELLNDGNGAKSRGMDGPEGSCHRLNLRTPDKGMILNYTFADRKGFVTYQPRCTFFGYRYMSITATSAVRIKNLKSVPVSSITKDMESGSISTGNELVNKLISNTIWGQRSNYLSVTTDCPQRNERLGWTADTQVFAETGTFFANTDEFFHKWMRDMRDTQSAFGGFPGVAPLAQYGAMDNNMMRLGWADAGIIVPWTVWKQFADTKIIDENWEAMERFIDHINETKYDHQALAAENGNYQWADWLSYEPLESCGRGAFETDASGKSVPKADAIAYWNYLSASYWAIDAGMMRDMAKASGRNVQKYQQMVYDAKKYLKETFFTSKGEFKIAILNTMQTPALFALKNELFDGQAKENMLNRLRKNFEQHGNCLQTGFLGTSILMETLTANGLSDVAYELLFQRKNPSWIYSIDNGATTIWERWNSYMLDKGMGPKGMNSFNHYAYGCVCQWLWETVAGIAADPSEPGFKHIIMRPVPDKRLGHLHAEYRSAAGLIKSDWAYEGDRWKWEITIPAGATASVTLPGETQATQYTSGTYVITKVIR